MDCQGQIWQGARNTAGPLVVSQPSTTLLTLAHLPEEGEGRMSRLARLQAVCKSQCRPGSAGQGCRGSEVGRTGHRRAGTEGPVEKGRVSVVPSNPWGAAFGLWSLPSGEPHPQAREGRVGPPYSENPSILYVGSPSVWSYHLKQGGAWIGSLLLPMASDQNPWNCRLVRKESSWPWWTVFCLRVPGTALRSLGSGWVGSGEGRGMRGQGTLPWPAPAAS
jgi:hypothetical protein